MEATFRTLALATATVWLAAPAAAQMKHAPQVSKGFQRLSTLAGTWEGQTSDGKTMQVSYQVVSNGTALMERLAMAGEAEMVTLYSSDGPRVAVTHYCSSGNQPQMSTGPITSDLKEFSFSFVRATNLASPEDGHMHHLTLTLEDASHLAQQWTWMDHGKAHTETFKFTRKG